MHKILNRGFNYIFCLLLVIPVFVLSIYSFNGNNEVVEWTNFSINPFLKLINNADFASYFLNSFFISSIVSTTSVLLAVLVCISDRNIEFVQKYNILFSFPLLQPKISLALSYLMYCSTVRIYFDAYFPPLYVMIFIYITICSVIATYITNFQYKKFRTSTSYKSLENICVSKAKKFLMRLMLFRHNIATSFIFIFIITFNDITISRFISGPDSLTLPFAIYTQMNISLTPELTSACFLILLSNIFWLAMLFKLNYKSRL